MADAIISPLVERIAVIIARRVWYEFNLVIGVKKELRDISKKLKKIREVLDDAEKKAVKEQSVKSWLKEVDNTAYEMDDILDEWNYSLLKHKHKKEAYAKQKSCCSLIRSSCLCFKKVYVRRKTSKKIENVKATLAEILKEIDELNLVKKLMINDGLANSLPATNPVPESWRESTSLIDSYKVQGLAIYRKKDDIVRNMMLNGGNTQILSIVGTGGLGKTTLAKLIFNDTQFEKKWLKIWVCVSDPFVVAVVAKKIVDLVGKETIPPDSDQWELALQKLKASVSGEKFLLVLDDVWTEDKKKWEPLKNSLKDGAPGSKILVTTRNERVAKMMGTLDDDIYSPDPLGLEECWSLLRDTSLPGKREEDYREYEVVGKKIASKCKGLPLAANVLGTLLQFKDLEGWEDVEKSDIWQLEEAKVDLFPHLALSYNELSPSHKRCFSYCAIYPKDHRIHAENLIEEWVALGYLGSVSGNDGVKLGRECFKKLAMRSLFQDFEKSKFGEQIEWCKMHDIVHDFALFLRKNDDREEAAEIRERSCQVCNPLLVSQAQEYRSLFWDKRSHPDLCDCVTSVRVSRFERGLDGPLPQGMEKLIHLRWLGLTGTKLNEEDLKIICSLYYLETLLLSSCSVRKIPGEIGDLVRLRNLDISENEFSDLPESMCSLVELQILNIKKCQNLDKLPESIHMLQNLQHLTGGTVARRGFLEGVAQLSGLRTLSGLSGVPSVNEFRVGSDWNKFELLKNLNLLTGSLTLRIYPDITCGVEELARTAGEAELRNKTHIQLLHILFHSTVFEDRRIGPPLSPISWKELLDALQPYQKLNNLIIWGYKGYALPRWMSSLNSVKTIHLRHFYHVSSLTHMGKLPFLEKLSLLDLRAIKFLGREFLGIESSSSSSSNHVDIFPKLKKLKFKNCFSWNEWEDITVEEEESTAVSIMPCLTHLTIDTCVVLKKLPHRLLRKASSLQILTTRYSSHLEKRYGDKEGSPWRSISQHNPQLKLVLS